MNEDLNWKSIIPDGLFLAFILFLLAYPLYGTIAQEQLWPGPGQNSPEISAYQISIFAQEAVQVVVVLVFVAFALIRNNWPLLQTTATLTLAYGLYSVIRATLLEPQYPFMTYGFGEILGGFLTLILLGVSKKMNATTASSAPVKDGPRKKR